MIKTEFGIELKNKLLKGIEVVNASVSSTLGPSGRNVLIRRTDGTISVTKDGVSVAISIVKLDDEIEDIGAQLLKQVAMKAADKVGDGTTTATLLATAMVREGIKSITQGFNPIYVKKGIDRAVKVVTDQLKSISREITSEDQIKQVATLSANNDVEIGTLIATAMDKVGRDGVVSIEESKSGETYLDTVEGMQFDRGYKSPFFVTDNNSMQAILDEPYILVYDDMISTGKQLVPVLSAINRENKSLLIIAQDIEGEALATLIVNKGRGIVKVAAVKAPEFGDRRLSVLEDIAIITGGTLLSKKKGHDLTKVNFDVNLLGKAKTVTISKDQTTIIDGNGDIDKITDRIEEIKSQLDKADSNFETEILQNRLAKMIGGVAVIYVGGGSEVEMRERKDRVDDALHATRAAIEEGIVPGGGMALMNCVQNLNDTATENGDEELGFRIVTHAIQEPFKKILSNAGIDDFYRILHCINKNIDDETSSRWDGYNVKTGEYENFLETGVIDPTKVTRTALENAASIAGTILTTESVVYLKEDDKVANTNEYSEQY